MSDLVPACVAAHLEAGRKASNLAFALRMLPPERRHEALVFYRFCRTIDDIADSAVLPSAEKSAALDAWQRALAESHGLPADIAALIGRYKIAPQLLLEILAGVRADLTVHRYATFEESRQYCWRVASAVGLVSIRIFGCVEKSSEAYADSLGLALQWTNILRDVGEDAATGRIYLPLEDLQRFDLSEDDLLQGRDTANFQRLMVFEADRAEQFFTEARHMLHPRDRVALRPAEIMRATYERLLHRMRSDGFQVFRRRYRLSRLEKLWLAAKIYLSR